MLYRNLCLIEAYIDTESKMKLELFQIFKINYFWFLILGIDKEDCTLLLEIKNDFSLP